MERLGIYTAIFGGYDTLKDQPVIPFADYHCFTDDPTIESDLWTVHRVQARYDHPRMAAKYFKLLPHKVMPDYPKTLWIDAGITLRRARRFARMALRTLDDHGIALFAHPDRPDVFAEAEFSRVMLKYRDLPVVEQVAHYRARGLPDGVGLYAGGILVRDSRQRRIRRLGRAWLRENEKWTYQDQLSLPYVLWRLRIEPAIIPFNLWENPFLGFVPHANET